MGVLDQIGQKYGKKEERTSSLADQVKRTFAESPKQLRERLWEESRQEHEQKYGREVKLNYDKQGRRSHFSVPVKDIKGFDKTEIIQDDVTREEIQLEMEKRQAVLDRAEQEGGTLDYHRRLEASAKLGANKKIAEQGYLEHHYGKGNVMPIYDGDEIDRFLITTPEGEVLKTDPTDNFQFSEIAGEIVENMPEILKAGAGISAGMIAAYLAARRGGAGALRFGMMATAATDALTGFAHQVYSKALPGEGYKNMTPLQELGHRAGTVATDVAIGQVGEGASHFLGKGLKALRRGDIDPSVTMRKAEEIGEDISAKKILRKAQKEQDLLKEEGKELAEWGGVPLTRGNITQDRFLLKVEDTLRQMPGRASTVMQAFDRERIVKFANKAYGLADHLGKKVVGSFNAGRALGNAQKRLTDSLVKKRTMESGKLFKEVMGKHGDKEIMSVDNLNSTLIEMSKTLSDLTPEGSSASKAFKYVTGQFKKLQGKEKVTLSEFQNLMSAYGEMAYGKEAIEGMTVSRTQAISRKIHRAIMKDFERNSNALTELGPDLKKLKLARKTWGEATQLIKDTRTVIGRKALGMQKNIEEEKVIEKFFTPSGSGGFTPGQIKQWVGVTAKTDPDTLKRVKTSALKDMFERASTDIDVADLSPQKVFSLIRKNRKKLEALFVDNKEGFSQIMKLGKLAERLGNKGFVGSSPTAGFQMFKEYLFSGSPVKAARTAYESAFSTRAAYWVNDPESLRMVTDIILRPGSKAVPKLVTRLKAREAQERYLMGEKEDE